MTDSNSATAELDFADQLALLSSALLQFRLSNKATLTVPKRRELEQLEEKLDEMTAQARARGVAALGKQISTALAEVQAASSAAAAFLEKIKQVEKVIATVTAFLGLGSAVLSGDVKTIVAAAKTVKDTVTA